MEDENKNKYDFLLSLLSEGDAMVCLDARQAGVDVPSGHKNDPSLNLILNLNFRRPIDIQKEGIFVTLSFQGRPHKCVVPFDAVWASWSFCLPFVGFSFVVWPKMAPSLTDQNSDFPAQPERSLPLKSDWNS